MASKSKAPVEGTSAAEHLAKLEERLFGKNAPRVNGKIERGHGSLFRQLSAEDMAAYCALEKLVVAEDGLSAAQGQLSAAQAAVTAAEANCTLVAKDAVTAKDAAETEDGLGGVTQETREQRRTRLAAEVEARRLEAERLAEAEEAELGLGSLLADQVGVETEELRKKRLQQAQQREVMGPAAFSLFGGMGGLSY
jgi:hypothetical protein